MLTYTVVNLMTGESWTGKAANAKEAYSHITINKGDTTTVSAGRMFSVREW